MSSLTSRAKLHKPDPVDAANFGDVRITENLTKIDSYVGAASFTSGTRPTGDDRFEARSIFETDTGNLMVWDALSNTWKYLARVDNQRERAWVQSIVSTTTTFGEALLTSRTFFATQNRRYRIMFCVYAEHVNNVNGSGFIRVRWQSGGSVSTFSILIRGNYLKLNSVGATGRNIVDVVDFLYTGPSTNITIGVFAGSGTLDSIDFNGTTDGTDVVGYFLIQDYGV